MKPTPKLQGAHWTVDLRFWGFGRHRLDVPAEQRYEGAAIHAAWELLISLRGEAERVGLVQQGLFDAKRRTFEVACAELNRARVFRTENGRLWWEKTAGYVRRDLGTVIVSAFEPPAGGKLLTTYRDRCRRPVEQDGFGLSAKTLNDRLCIVKQVLQREVTEGHLSRLPTFPEAVVMDGERIYTPEFVWIDEVQFRLLRAGIYADPTTFGGLRATLAKAWRREVTDADILDYIARRKLYLSFAFYTGHRTADLDALTEAHVYPEAGRYRRHSSKTARFVRDEWPEMPEPLALDVQDELRRLGRAWTPGEAICGGRWSTVARVCHQTSRDIALGVHVNPRVLRRSFVRELRLRGYSRDDVRLLMGHTAESALVDEVYDQVPAPDVSVRSRWACVVERDSVLSAQPGGGVREASGNGAESPTVNVTAADRPRA